MEKCGLFENEKRNHNLQTPFFGAIINVLRIKCDLYRFLLLIFDKCFRKKLPKFEKPLSFSFSKGIIHNLESLSFQKMCSLYGFLFKTQAQERSMRGRS